jgi:benzoylformate decarboxylase
MAETTSDPLATALDLAGTPRPSVRDATLDVLRERRMHTIFANPGSTEVPFLVGLPPDLEFVLGLHEASVVGLASGFALATGTPAFVLLHTTAGLGNAVGALATARVNRAPLVVVVGQQDRRHLAFEPFLAGRLQGLAGDYPVWVETPVRPQDVPGAIARAWHEANAGLGPALVIVPMDDWLAEADTDREAPVPQRLVRASAADETALAALVELLDGARSPVLVVGAGADDPATWSALEALAERLACSVWQESFGGRAGFPQDHPRFAGHLPADRPRLRETLAAHDVVLAVGAPIFRQYPYASGRLLVEGTRAAIVTADAAEAHRSPAELAVVAPPAAVCAALARRVAQREAAAAPSRPPVEPPAGGALRAGHVFDALAQRLPADAILVEETPSSRPELHARIPARSHLGFVSAAMGGLGFALPAAAGLRLGAPTRPVVAVVGDGSSLYSIQALWSAMRYRAGVLFIVLHNGGYAVMDRLAESQSDGGRPWPSFDEIDVTAIARGFGCPARRVDDHATLLALLDEVVPTLADRDEPLLVEVVVEPDETFEP